MVDMRELGSLSPDIKVLAVTLPIWVVVNVAYGTIPLVANWVFAPVEGGNAALPVSLFWAVATLALSFLWLRASTVVRILLAMTTPFAFLSVFEIVYQHLFLLARPSLFKTDLPGEIILASWILLGFTTISHWKLSKISLVILVTLTGTFALWSLVGYPQIYEGNGLFAEAFAFNAASKSLTALLFLSLLWEGGRSQVKATHVGPTSPSRL